MLLTKSNPINSSSRHKIKITKNLLCKKSRLLKNLIFGKKKNAGRSSSNGRITIRHQGSGCKALIRKIDFSTKKYLAIIISIEYDPNRSSFISLAYDLILKKFFYTLNTESVKVGTIISSDFQFLNLGNRLSIKDIPTGSIIHSISSNKNHNKTAFIRSAGTYGQLIQKEEFLCKIKMPSGKILSIPQNSFCTLGVLSNSQHNLQVLGKAGTNRLKGIRPTVRGIAMNPVDHPHGGRTNGGRPSVTPWGIPTKGKPTVLKSKK
jgi:large subunit ribosomal protein L2